MEVNENIELDEGELADDPNTIDALLLPPTDADDAPKANLVEELNAEPKRGDLAGSQVEPVVLEAAAALILTEFGPAEAATEPCPEVL